MPFLAINTGALDPTTGAPVFNLWGQLRLLNNGAPASATIQWRAKDNSTPWISVGDPVPVDTFGYFTGTRTAPLPVVGEWRSALIVDGAIAAFSPGTQGT